MLLFLSFLEATANSYSIGLFLLSFAQQNLRRNRAKHAQDGVVHIINESTQFRANSEER